ncbi:hypothetical protein HIM_09709 [Hirsutella minnesotensis 3608]|uniref:Terpenoid synthase n=1 Tax=Hirsutella minnesotensis 3608 TaxID=1043627 RepID=A0A0F7ZGH8_9HYPO|nr:hypothetical protein HIM_09709 [Hirsutella minnesotensis 3608]
MATPTPNDANLVTPAHYRSLVEKFLRDINFEMPEFSRDPVLERFLIEDCTMLVRQQGLDLDIVPDVVSLAAMTSSLIYPFHDQQEKKCIARYTSYFFLIEDLGEKFLESNRRFRQNVISQRRQPPILEAFLDLQADFDELYGLFSTDMIYKGLFDFISASTLEFDIGNQFEVQPTAPFLPDYLRMKTALPEPFVYFVLPKSSVSDVSHLIDYIQAVPDLMIVANATNDLLSFYKESILGSERSNFIYQYASARQKMPLEALEAVSKRLRNIAFHFQLPRYRLLELHLF